jgi:monofunctional glycosyltransferase
LTEQPVGQSDTPSALSPGRAQRILRWMHAHKWKTAVLLVGAFVLFEFLTLPFVGVYRLRSENPSESALMRQRLNEAEDDGKPLKIVRQWIPLSRLPKHVVDAIIVAEDGTFFEHGGIDWFEVQESFEKNLEEGRPARGASTITQQLAKNLFLSTSKDPIRKLKEVVITLMMERVLSKQRILELYVNIVEWGRGIFGIEAAARTYFGKPASALSLDEATRLAAVIPSPLRHMPNSDSRYVLRRKAIVLDRMSSRNWLRDARGSAADSAKPLQQMPADVDSEQPLQQMPAGSAPPPTAPDTTATDQGRGDGLQGRQSPD